MPSPTDNLAPMLAIEGTSSSRNVNMTNELERWSTHHSHPLFSLQLVAWLKKQPSSTRGLLSVFPPNGTNHIVWPSLGYAVVLPSPCYVLPFNASGVHALVLDMLPDPLLHPWILPTLNFVTLPKLPLNYFRQFISLTHWPPLVKKKKNLIVKCNTTIATKEISRLCFYSMVRSYHRNRISWQLYYLVFYSLSYLQQ